MASTGERAKSSARAQLAEYRKKRDFTKTAEPSGEAAPASKQSGRLRFVIQKHAATRLHFDLRLELDGVMKSWAVPKGPSVDPSVKRLAMQVEDHPVDYNTFEGTIPKGEYGGGTVMLWDRGTYTSDVAASPDEEEDAIRDGLKRGDLKITFHGDRLHGSFALIRMKFSRDKSPSAKPQWLLIKHRDEHAATEDIIEENMTSVDTGRTMEEIATGKSKVWHSDREPKGSASRKFPLAPKPSAATAKKRSAAKESSASETEARGSSAGVLEPMYASVGSEVPGAGWTFEPKYDGIRVLAYATSQSVKLVTRNGKDKAQQFPEIVASLKKLASQTRKSLVLDGEIVALIDGEPARFQELQSRMHVKESTMIEHHSSSSPAALILFDMLVDGDDILIREPWTKRRERLVKRIGKRESAQLRVTDSGEGDGAKMLEKARRQGWEGIIAKKTDSRYEPGHRSKSWLKLKIEFRQEFVIGGYTEPRNSREHIGALLLGYFDHGRFIYVGHTGGGFTRQGLVDMYKRLEPLEIDSPPFEETPKTNEKAHWVKPKIVVEVKFNEWTSDRRLRQPIFLGVRDDKPASKVGLEAPSVQKKPARSGSVVKRKTRRGAAARAKGAAKSPAAKAKTTTRRSEAKSGTKSDSSSIVAQLTAIEESGRDGSLDFGDGRSLKVTNLGKVFFPKEKITKGAVMRYYARVADFILPAIKDRPLVLRRFPNGIEGEAFYQQNASETTPKEVRVEVISNDEGEKQQRFIGGDLLTLLYTIQLGAISVDPWHSRVQSCDYADYTIIDLDPGPRANFERVKQVAGWAKDVIHGFGLKAAIKTSGSRGLHIYIPLPADTPNDAATLVAQMIATKVADAHPKEATIERFVKARGGATVYVDYLQNIKGKTVAGAYCVRARPGATVSTPLLWSELDDDLEPGAFTIENAPERFEKLGDIWGEAMKQKNSLRALV